MEERLNKIEFKVANQDNVIEELSSVIYEQQKQIDQLERILRDILKSSQMDIGQHNVRPPHY